MDKFLEHDKTSTGFLKEGKIKIQIKNKKFGKFYHNQRKNFYLIKDSKVIETDWNETINSHKTHLSWKTKGCMQINWRKPNRKRSKVTNKQISKGKYECKKNKYVFYKILILGSNIN